MSGTTSPAARTAVPAPAASVPAVSPLFRPFTVGGLSLPNRIAMAPMTRNFSPNGVPGPEVAEYYARRARGGVGLIVTEGTVVGHAASAPATTVPRFHGEDALAGWAGVVAAVHAEGGRIIPQLWHAGLERKGDGVPDPQVPAAGPATLSESDIAEVVAAFGRAAADAKRLGFDGLELHGGHGYLIDQFLRPESNTRTDGYGGDLGGRTRFAAEVVAACRAAVGYDFPIFLRISQWTVGDFGARLAATPDELELLLGPLIEAGADVIDCSTRRFWLPEFAGSDLSLAGWVKKLTGLPTVAVGSVGLDDSEFQSALIEGKGAANGSLDRLVELMERDEFDLVAVGRLLLSDPEWVAKIREGRHAELRPFSAEALLSLV
ncbi:NADH:flavin oxidoreductase [Streptomyces regalis]|uniref:1,2-oxophytodienoate reductase n=1 Tax=Streptomyces regalis TaxID=68262 RepID=A0A101JSH9_9ACTN|nr:NADH:flavin oxidoreductase [Streptomyces regalis]KUL32207.1 1,2-oxophytodienoate reductase [Streptomyces regalis]